MRKLSAFKQWLPVALLLVLISGCAFIQHAIQPKGLPERIIDTRLLAAAMADEITASVSSVPPLITKEVAQARLNDIKNVQAKLLQADKFIDLKELGSAQAQYDLADTLLKKLRAELAIKATKKGGAT